jgi:endo-1,4-beta-mannosidase
LPVKDATPEKVGNRFEKLLNLVRQDFPEMYLLPALTDLYDNTPFHPMGDDEFYEVQPDNWKILGKKWYTEGYLVNYLPFVEYIVRRFKGEPQIFAWEIGNELKNPHGGRPRDFIDFNLAVAHRIRALDPGQLITTGLLSTCHSGIFDPGKERLYGSEDIDFVTNHIYDFGRKEDPNDHCLHKHDRFWAEKAGKPWLIEEAGFESRNPDEDRGPIVEEDMSRWFGLGASGYMQWAFMGGGKNNGDGDWRHGMDEQSDWHRDWSSLAGIYRRRADSLRAQ